MSHNDRLLGSKSNPLLLPNTLINNSRAFQNIQTSSVDNLNLMLTNLSK